VAWDYNGRLFVSNDRYQTPVEVAEALARLCSVANQAPAEAATALTGSGASIGLPMTNSVVAAAPSAQQFEQPGRQHGQALLVALRLAN
jgi:hypothetical protein